jgi:hypothetical protein
VCVCIYEFLCDGIKLPWKTLSKKVVRIDTKKAFGLITTSILGTGKCQEI